jgi:eukaryotic-like serine/threonine-protein kinase
MQHSVPSPGQLVGGKYRVIGLLGQGGMGAVLEVEHEITHKRLAIKWMHPDRAGDADAHARFVREAQASARVRHPNIVDVYDVGHEGGALFLVMELLEGETLTSLLRRGGVPIHALIALLLPALRAVSAAHRQGVIHRDLKPDNIFLAREPDVALPVAKVLDFGISKINDPSSLSLTRTGAAVGTPMYMSLEQLRGDKDVDGRADVYALGVILYEAVTGRTPFEAETFSELAIKVATLEPPLPKQIRPDLPTELANVIAAAIAKKREQRLASVDVLIKQLEPFAAEHSFRAKMTHRQAAMPLLRSETPRPPRETPPLAIQASEQLVEAAPTHSKTEPSTAPRASTWRKPKVLVPLALAPLLIALAVVTLRKSDQPVQPARAGRSVAAQPVIAPATQEPVKRTGAIELSALPLGDAGAAVPANAPLPGENGARREAGGLNQPARVSVHRADDAPAKSARPPRSSVIKRAGPARIDDF